VGECDGCDKPEWIFKPEYAMIMQIASLPKSIHLLLLLLRG
jgi:hypothetical protein